MPACFVEKLLRLSMINDASCTEEISNLLNYKEYFILLGRTWIDEIGMF